jgi:hypothetical protein
MRNLTAAIALVCAVVQLAFGSSLAAGALTLGIYASHLHGHSLALQADGDHVDLVLSHRQSEVAERTSVPDGHDHPASYSEGDHVVHVLSGGAADATPRRALLDPAPAIALSIAFAGVITPPRSLHSPLEPRARGTDQLRTVVLQV